MSDFVSAAQGSPVPTDSVDEAAAPPAPRRLRLWPGVVIVALQAALILVPGWVAPGTMTHFMAMFWGPMVGAVALLLWWVFFSRLRWADRGIVLVAFFGAAGAAARFSDPTFRFGLLLYVLPLVTSAWVLWLLVTARLSWPVRRAGLVALLVVGWACGTPIRMDGVTGRMSAELHWRWSPTAEQLFLAGHHTGTAPASAGDALSLQPGDWPGFRGPDRDGRATGTDLVTDWKSHPPRPPLWRHRVGPGWGSFAVVGRRLYTQEQRGDAEAVVCYDADNGDELWAHTDEARFIDETRVSGVGPRATPTFHEGKVYALGGTGRLNCLDAATGAVVWWRDAAADTGAKVPPWGFASSPLVWQGVVSVYTGGPDNAAVIGYDLAGGEPVWKAGEGQMGYSSPQPARIAGVDQLLIATDAGVTSLHPTRGDVLWAHHWPSNNMPRCVQPAVVGDDVLLGSGMGQGERRLHPTRDGDGWAEPAEVWTSRALSAYYNDRVVHKGHVYGFDGGLFTCLSLDTGKARWRGGRYGNGQVLLLADQDLLVVLSEKGEAVLVAADPEKHRELGRFQAVEGKTWNHPVIVRGRLFVRNGEEAACYTLSLRAEEAAPK